MQVCVRVYTFPERTRDKISTILRKYNYCLSVREKIRSRVTAATDFSHCFETKTAESEESHELHLIYTHKLNPGVGPTDHYGISLAEVSSLPKCVTTKAREYASRQSTAQVILL